MVLQKLPSNIVSITSFNVWLKKADKLPANGVPQSRSIGNNHPNSPVVHGIAPAFSKSSTLAFLIKTFRFSRKNIRLISGSKNLFHILPESITTGFSDGFLPGRQAVPILPRSSPVGHSRHSGFCPGTKTSEATLTDSRK